MKHPAAVIAVLASALLLFVLQAAGGEKFSVKEVPLAVEHRTVHHETFLPAFVENIVVTPDYAAFIASRAVWIKQRNKQPVPLSSLVKLPGGFDWYVSAVAIGERMLISVGNYSEQQRQKDNATKRGGYIRGPEPAGMLLVQLKPAKATLVNSIRVVKGQAQAGAVPEPDTIVPKFQSCFFDGKDLYIGEYGFLARINLDSMSAELLEVDEMMFSRLAVWKEGSTLWYAADEGGMAGSWISKLDISDRTPRSLMDYSLMNDGFTIPDAIVRYQGRLLSSSLAGVVETDEKNRTFIQYQLFRDPKKMRVYKLSVIQGLLWGLREDGWVRFDLENGKAVHYQFAGDPVLNNIFSICHFDGQWYVGTKNQVVTIKGNL